MTFKHKESQLLSLKVLISFFVVRKKKHKQDHRLGVCNNTVVLTTLGMSTLVIIWWMVWIPWIRVVFPRKCVPHNTVALATKGLLPRKTTPVEMWAKKTAALITKGLLPLYSYIESYGYHYFHLFSTKEYIQKMLHHFKFSQQLWWRLQGTISGDLITRSIDLILRILP